MDYRRHLSAHRHHRRHRRRHRRVKEEKEAADDASGGRSSRRKWQRGQTHHGTKPKTTRGNFTRVWPMLGLCNVVRLGFLRGGPQKEGYIGP